MNHASLFSGIGGFDIAAAWCGWKNIFHCENDSFCRRTLQHHFPESESYGDIRSLTGGRWGGSVDVLSGGFPCQPFSVAGRRGGEEDNRFLWPEMLRVIREVSPAWVVAENVPGIITINGGLVFEGVCSDMEGLGYEVSQPFCIPACSLDAEHRRDRIWFVAHNPRIRVERIGEAWNSIARKMDPETLSVRDRDGQWKVEPDLLREIHGIPEGLDGISLPEWRKQSIKAYGNAIVPQIAYVIFQSIQKACF